MRTHIQRSELDAIALCCGYTQAVIDTAWGSNTELSIEEFITLPIMGLPKTPARDSLYILGELMTRHERLEFGFRVIDDCEDEYNNIIVRSVINTMADFLQGNATAQDVQDKRVVIQNLMFNYLGDRESKRYKMIDATRQLMNAQESRKSMMRICRFVEGHHTDVTYEKFLELSTKILKEELQWD